MDLTTLSASELEAGLTRAVRSERKITHLVLRFIIEVESRKLHIQKGCDSMQRYLTRHMGYSDGCAYSRMQAARVLKNVPEVAEKIESGSINLSQLIQVQKCIREKVQQGKMVSHSQTLEVLNHIENKNSYDTQKSLAQDFDLPIQTREIVTPQKDNSMRMEIVFNEEQQKEILQAKENMSHICPDGNWAELFTAMARKINKIAAPKKSSTGPKTSVSGYSDVASNLSVNKSNGISSKTTT